MLYNNGLSSQVKTAYESLVKRVERIDKTSLFSEDTVVVNIPCFTIYGEALIFFGNEEQAKDYLRKVRNWSVIDFASRHVSPNENAFLYESPTIDFPMTDLSTSLQE